MKREKKSADKIAELERGEESILAAAQSSRSGRQKALRSSRFKKEGAIEKREPDSTRGEEGSLKKKKETWLS